MNERQETLIPLTLSASNTCFGCGVANPDGLQLKFFEKEDHSVVAITTMPPTYESYPGSLHGGIIATLLDEAMGKSVRARGYSTVTRHMEVDFLRPVPCSAPLRIEGHVTRNEGRKHWSEARILNEHGKVLAQSKGLFVEVVRGEEKRAEEKPAARS